MEDRLGTKGFSVAVIDPDLLSSVGTGFNPAEYERELIKNQYKVIYAILIIIRQVLYVKLKIEVLPIEELYE